jgi:hypothetical protein
VDRGLLATVLTVSDRGDRFDCPAFGAATVLAFDADPTGRREASDAFEGAGNWYTIIKGHDVALSTPAPDLSVHTGVSWELRNTITCDDRPPVVPPPPPSPWS